MFIDTITLSNFMVFKNKLGNENEERLNSTGICSIETYLDFCQGINVIIGPNGTGKSTILKLLYAACEWTKIKEKKAAYYKDFYKYFTPYRTDNKTVKNYDNRNEHAGFTVTSGKHSLSIDVDQMIFDLNDQALDNWLMQEVNSVLIPTIEMLSHSKGFLAFNEKYEMPFDRTLVDILINAELPRTREISPNSQILINKLSDILEGEVIYEDDTFYVNKRSGMKLEFSFEAEGLRKIGLLWQLLRNGLLESGSILYWDEPECNLNPELMPDLVDILLNLQRNGVQIFIATHSEILAGYFNVNHQQKDKIMFYSLYKENDHINVNSNSRFDFLEPNSLYTAPVKLYEQELDKGLGNIGLYNTIQFISRAT